MNWAYCTHRPVNDTCTATIRRHSTYDGRCSRINAVVDSTSMSFFLTAGSVAAATDDVMYDDDVDDESTELSHDDNDAALCFDVASS